MKLIKFLLILLLPIAGFSQIQGEDEVYLNGDRIDAKFAGGGIENFTAFIDRNFDYSKVAKAGKLEGAFTIDEQGNVTKIRITQVLDIESATEFIRVLKMCPKWEPAKRNGKPISIEIKYPMVFKEKVKKQESNDEVDPKPLVESNSNIDNKVYEFENVEVKPKLFAGGLNKFYEFIGKNFQVPDEEGLKGKIIVTFIIDIDGSVTDIKIIKDIGYGTGKEAIRVLKMMPKWTPGRQNGKPIRCQYSLPITIRTK